MTITLTYKLDASKLAGTTTVVFETLYTAVTEEMGVEVGRHHDLTDEGQTVYIPEIHTTAADQKTEINHTKSEETATIIVPYITAICYRVRSTPDKGNSYEQGNRRSSSD